MKKKIKDISIVFTTNSCDFQTELKAQVDRMQANGLEVEIKDPRFIISPDALGTFNYVATVIGYETLGSLPLRKETERCPLEL